MQKSSSLEKQGQEDMPSCGENTRVCDTLYWDSIIHFGAG